MALKLEKLTGAEALARVAPLFANREERLIRCVLEGNGGYMWTVGTHRAALCENGDFLFAAGDADGQRRLLECWKNENAGRFVILIPQGDIAGIMENVFGAHAARAERYAFDSPPNDVEALERMTQHLPQGVVLHPFDENICRMALDEEWSRDFCSQFESVQDYLSRGCGVAALHNGELVGGASSYIRLSDAIEIQVDTRSDWQRRGIASACSAALILECLRRGLAPGWDADNPVSAHLAQKLGYRPKGAYEVWKLYQTT